MYSIQADATAYFGRIVSNAALRTVVFPFRIVINLSRFDNDLSAILSVMNRNSLVDSIFKFSHDSNQRTIVFNGGVVAANASGMLPPQVRLLENRLVIFEDTVIYFQAPPPSLELPTTLDFDMSIVAVSQLDPSRSESFRYAIGTVSLVPPPGEYGYYLCTLLINYYTLCYIIQLLLFAPCI